MTVGKLVFGEVILTGRQLVMVLASSANCAAKTRGRRGSAVRP